MGVIAALVPNATRLQRLRAAARQGHSVVPCEGWEDLYRVTEEQLVHTAVLDLVAAGAPNFDPVRRLKRRHPRITLIAYVGVTPDWIHAVFDAGRYGFEALVVADVDDGPTTFRRALDMASARGIATLVGQALRAASAPPVAHDATLIAVTRAHEVLTPALLAQVIGIHPRQLTRKLSDAGYPSAHRLITWGRLIVAADMMSGTPLSAARIARALRFPSATAFRNTCQRYLASTPGAIRERGGATFVLETLFGSDITPANTAANTPRTSDDGTFFDERADDTDDDVMDNGID